MKYLIIFLFLLAPFSSMAQVMTPVPNDVANKYFANCVAQPPSQQFTVQAQQTLCACTAARMTQFFSMEDMKAMTDAANPAAQRPAFNKMLVNIYAPCMEEPTREFHYNACISDPETKRYGDPAKICRCMADEVAAHMKVHGPTVFEELLSRNPNMTDPMSALADDPSFQTFAKSKLLACLK
jgi:hypothetical protein